LSYSFKKLLLFEIPYSIFDIQNEKHAKAIRLKGEGFKPGEWKNKITITPINCDLTCERELARLRSCDLSSWRT